MLSENAEKHTRGAKFPPGKKKIAKKTKISLYNCAILVYNNLI